MSIRGELASNIICFIAVNDVTFTFYNVIGTLVSVLFASLVFWTKVSAGEREARDRGE